MKAQMVISLLSVISSAVVSGGQTDLSNFGCIVRLRVPSYPAIARSARISGLADAKVIVGSSGQAAKIEVNGVRPILKSEVEGVLRTAVYAASCERSEVRITFEFVISGDAVENPNTGVSYEAPNHFIITTRPALPMP